MNKELILKEDTHINVIGVTDKKNNNVFMSQNLNMTLMEYIELAEKNHSKQFPDVISKKVSFISSFGGTTSNGGTFTASLYQYNGHDVNIVVGVID